MTDFPSQPEDPEDITPPSDAQPATENSSESEPATPAPAEDEWVTAAESASSPTSEAAATVEEPTPGEQAESSGAGTTPAGEESQPAVEAPGTPAEEFTPSPPPPPPGPPPPPTPATYQQPLTPSEERTWAMLAHLSVLVNLVTGFLGPVVALVIYLAYKDRSRYVAYQSMQAFLFQLIAWVGFGILAIIAWTISGLLVVILIGCLLMPFALLFTLVPLAALVYGVVGAIQTNQGQDFKYWLVGDWVRGTLHNP